MVKKEFLKEYLEADQEKPKGAVALRDQVHEIPIYEELNTFLRGFFGGGSSVTKYKRYGRAVMSLETRRPNHAQEPALCFTGVDLENVVSHENDPVVISVVTVGAKGA